MFVFKLCFLLYLYQVHTLEIHLSDMGPEKMHINAEDAEELFKEFIEKYDKQYDETEYLVRLEVFKENLHDINNRNEEHDAVFGITEFTDLTDEEFQNKHTGLKRDFWSEVNYTEELDFEDLGQDVPESWDWRQHGLVTHVRNQGHCQSCWAFSAVGVIEGQYAKKHNQQRVLSDQQMVDCFVQGGGCRTGSFPHLAFNEAARVGGYMSGADYPYTGREGSCLFRKDKVVAKVQPGNVNGNVNEEALKKFVYSFGPVSAAIFSAGGFSKYRGGIATASSLNCRGQRSDHAVLIVGYGVENGTPYWIIKNSHGSNWGEQGYLRLERGKNTCNIATYIAYATVL